jgi:hypothetical protein
MTDQPTTPPPDAGQPEVEHLKSAAKKIDEVAWARCHHLPVPLVEFTLDEALSVGALINRTISAPLAPPREVTEALLTSANELAERIAGLVVSDAGLDQFELDIERAAQMISDWHSAAPTAPRSVATVFGEARRQIEDEDWTPNLPDPMDDAEFGMSEHRAALNAPARVDENALPLHLLHKNLKFSSMVFEEDEQLWFVTLCDDPDVIGCTPRYIIKEGPTPRAAMIAAIEAARERGDG